MSIQYASSTTFLSTPSPKTRPSSSSSSFPSIKTPFLGFSKFTTAAAAIPSLRTSPAKKFQIRCQNLAPAVPEEQQWMFDGDIDGPDIWNKTWYPKAADHKNTEKTWYIVDATDKILGRLASTIAIHIRGKNLATYTPSVDMGAYVIVVNAEKVAVSGKKRTQKLYRRHSGRPGGMKVETFDQLQQRIPERIVEHAVRGMLPKGRLGRALFTHLKVYKGPDHPHEAQQPIELPIRDKRVQVEK
ncbi:large ribosomal subunit protein uL13c [Magnolia sinica]|uniref:large ribosomal subunit protein uL13c n=1 Tax=Magnolia sinica TaxID=86752 RepID=UPI0026584B6A|nr:large ribosomal subunit protein uL13c [Magnolia sinica]